MCYITLTTIEDVKDFVNKTTKCPKEIDVTSGRYTVSGKSLMGLFSLSFDRPLQISTLGGELPEQFLEDIAKYRCDESGAKLTTSCVTSKS